MDPFSPPPNHYRPSCRTTNRLTDCFIKQDSLDTIPPRPSIWPATNQPNGPTSQRTRKSIMFGLPNWLLFIGGVFISIGQAVAGAAAILCTALVCPIGCTAICMAWTVRNTKRWGRGRQLRRAQRRGRGQQQEEETSQGREAVPPNSNSNEDANRAVLAPGVTAVTGEHQRGESVPQHPRAVRSMASEEEIMVRRHSWPPSYRSQESFPPTRRNDGEEIQSDPPLGYSDRGDRAAPWA
ncbi:hypothetical protein BKA80DRAFT_92841 [Phyllosticta citrichinensis]